VRRSNERARARAREYSCLFTLSKLLPPRARGLFSALCVA
jgi:hypothetical protein